MQQYLINPGKLQPRKERFTLKKSKVENKILRKRISSLLGLFIAYQAKDYSCLANKDDWSHIKNFEPKKFHLFFFK